MVQEETETADGGATSGAGPQRQANNPHAPRGTPQALGGPGQSPAAPHGCRKGFTGSHPGPSWAAPPLPGRSAGAAAAGPVARQPRPSAPLPARGPRSLPAPPLRGRGSPGGPAGASPSLGS